MSTAIERKLFILVPDGSTLVMRVTSQSEEFVASAEAARDGQKLKTRNHGQLVNKTTELPLESPHRYTVLVQMAFTGAADAMVGVMATVVKPDGTIHSQPWSVTFTGQQGDTASAVISVVTRKTAPGGNGDEG